MGQGAALKRRDFLAASTLPLLGCKGTRNIEGGLLGANHERGHLLRPGEPGKDRTWPAPSVTRRTRVLIAGGGVAGLAAARALRLRGMDDFAMLELEDSAGGNSRGGVVGGLPCPLGAHYLPVPGDAARDVQDLLEELSLRRRVAGRWEYDERHLCHSPQERLFIHGQWQEGLLPLPEMDIALLADYQRFARLVQQASAAAPFSIPLSASAPAPQHRALDAMTFEAWLDQQQLTRAPLRWYLDYCCRDDYGAGLDTVSAWARSRCWPASSSWRPAGWCMSWRREPWLLTCSVIRCCSSRPSSAATCLPWALALGCRGFSSGSCLRIFCASS